MRTLPKTSTVDFLRDSVFVAAGDGFTFCLSVILYSRRGEKIHLVVDVCQFIYFLVSLRSFFQSAAASHLSHLPRYASMGLCVLCVQH